MNSKPATGRMCAAITTLVLGSVASAQSSEYSIQDLAPLPGGMASGAQDISDAGDVAGSASDTNLTQASWWPQGQQVPIGLGTLPGGTYSLGFDINDPQQIVGESDTAGPPHAFLWSPQTVMLDLGVLPGGNIFQGSSAQAINNLGHVVGRSWSSQGNRAFFWSAQTGMISMGVLPGDASSIAHDINIHDVAVGGSTGTALNHAFKWSAAGGMMQLLPPPQHDSCEAMAINDHGDVVGWCATIVGDFYRAVLWPADGSPPILLGTVVGPNGPDQNSIAEDINNDRVVVGQSFTPNFSIHPFRWTAQEGIVNLRDHAPPYKETGIWMNDALGINNSGQIVGEANFQNQETHGFQITPTPLAGDVDGNGTVNVNDLLAVITTWGPCPASLPCPADLDGNGVVNVNDLLTVTSHWQG